MTLKPDVALQRNDAVLQDDQQSPDGGVRATPSFLLGLSFGVVFPLYGNLILAEFWIVAWGMLALRRPPILSWPKNLLPITYLLAVAACGLIVADCLSQQDLTSSFKTWIRFLLVPGLSFAFGVLYTRKLLSFRWLFIGLGGGVLIGVATHAGYLVPTRSPIEDYWKYNVGSWLSIACIALIPSRLTIVQLGALAAITLLSAKLGFRSLALECIFVACALLVQKGLTQSRGGSSSKRVVAIIFIAVSLGGAIAAYNSSASSGLFGRLVQLKHLAETESEGGLLGSGRPELAAGIQAVISSPILPAGSNPKFSGITGVYLRRAGNQTINHYLLSSQDREILPIHSVLFDSWIRGGITGGIAWLITLWMCIRVIDRYLTRDYGEPYIVLLAVMMIWNIWFSPVSPQYRLTNAASLALMCVCARPMRVRAAAGSLPPPRRGVQMYDSRNFFDRDGNRPAQDRIL